MIDAISLVTVVYAITTGLAISWLPASPATETASPTISAALTIAEQEISAPPTPSPTPVVDAPTPILPWWGWVLAVLGLSAMTIVLWVAVKR